MFSIRDQSGSEVASFDDQGNLYLNGGLTTNTTPQSTEYEEFRIQGYGQDVAIISMSTGDMTISGSLNENQVNMTGANNFVVKDNSSNPVAYIDTSGNLFLKGYHVQVQVTHIKFNHSAGDSSDAIDIRENSGTDITVPEWVKGGQNKPAAYKGSTSVTVQARFTVYPTTITSAKIRAVASGTGTILGNLGETTVTFSQGVSSPEYVQFPSVTTASAVGKGALTWQWLVRDIQGSGSNEREFDSSGPHTIYTVLTTPCPPQAEPWVLVLDYACPWASGATGKDGACSDTLSNGFANHYTWNMNCHRLASDFCQLVASLGVSPYLHRWASKSAGLGDMYYQRTKQIDPVGSTWGYGSIDWSWHQWAEAESM